ncbi:MAG TPA: hypothetical protein VHQ92_01085 [Pseudolabrys sp.]|jgi:hypothetical protein|nr:hypothetical protein [Pseudolabrys sp.]
MSFTFRPAIRESVNLLIGLAGGTGSGKSFSALRLATGMAGGEKFAVLDSENRRALHYAEQFKFDYAELRAPFRPDTYADAIMAADAAGYPVIVVDQVSYEHAGDGGLLDWQEEELDRMAGQDYKKREACKMASWIKPKMGHKHMMQKLLQVRAHLILCMRAEPKIEMVKGDDGKWKIVPKQSLVGLDGWIPICEKSLPYELTASFLLTADAPGIPRPIKLQAQHRPLFPLDKPITEDSGRLIAQWACGASKDAIMADSSPPTIGSKTEFITDVQQAYIEVTCQDHGIPVAALKKAAKVELLTEIYAADYPRVKEWLNTAIAKRKAA